MAKQLNSNEIISKLRQADMLIGQGKTVLEVCREIGVTSQTYRWRNEYGGMSPAMIKKFKDLLKRISGWEGGLRKDRRPGDPEGGSPGKL